MREKKTHLYVDSREKSLLLHSLVELKNQLIQQGKYGDCVDELIFKVANVPIKKVKIEYVYQRASIAIEGFEDTKLPDSHFDVVLGNVPFGEFKVDDSRYNAQKFLIHDYFFARRTLPRSPYQSASIGTSRWRSGTTAFTPTTA